MIRLIENCDIRELIKAEHPEAMRRYWAFSAYSGPCYFVTDENGELLDDEDGYIEGFCYPGQNFINMGKLYLASPYFQMDEWTTLIGFVSSPEKAPEIANSIAEDDLSLEKAVSKFPDIELIGFLWVDGWWELFGDLEVAFSMVNQKLDLSWVDTEASIYLSKECNKDAYYASRDHLRRKIEGKEVEPSTRPNLKPSGDASGLRSGQ